MYLMCSFFSKLDTFKGYFQIPVRQCDVSKTAVTTPFGLFEFLWMPFGLRNAGATFQRLMDNLFESLHFTFVYMDDILVFSGTLEEHMRHLRLVFQTIQKAGLQVNPEKCSLGVSSINFLGHTITADGIAPDSTKLKAIQSFPPPSNIKEVQRFLGLSNYYRHFVPGASHLMAPLSDSTRLSPKHWTWSTPLNTAFEEIKAALTQAVMLAHQDVTAELSLSTDASDRAVGAVLEQCIEGFWQPLGFFSQKLTPTETHYATIDRELLAAFLVVKHFRHLLEGRNFTLYSDHKPLSFAFLKNTDPLSARQQPQLSFLSEFNVTMLHISGKTNQVADAMSRACSVLIDLNSAKISAAQENSLDSGIFVVAFILHLHENKPCENRWLASALQYFSNFTSSSPSCHP